MSSILITGGCGFVGSRVAEMLLERQTPLVVLDSFTDYYDPSIKRRRAERLAASPYITVVEGDIRDHALLDCLFRKHDIKYVLNMAAIPGVRAPMERTQEYFEVNAMAVLRMFELSVRYGVENFVQASTSSVYGATMRVPFVEEDTADRPLAAYPASKRSAEMGGHFFHHLYGLNVTCLRFFNVYGPNGRPDMMPLKILKAIRDDEPITLYNEGHLSRDWTYVDDTAAGVIAALDRPLGYEVINLGYGSPISMKTFVDICESFYKKSVKRVMAPAPPTEAPITYCNNARARRLLNFTPKMPVAEGLRKTWEWFASVERVAE